jgi:hypothetical protein
LFQWRTGIMQVDIKSLIFGNSKAILWRLP